MADQNRKRSRKSGLVPRDLEWHRGLPGTDQIPTRPRVLSKLNSAMAAAENPPRSPSPPRVEFNVSIECEELPDDIEPRTDGCLINTELKLANDVLRKECEQTFGTTTSWADKTLEIEIRNNWGRCFKASKGDSLDQALQIAFSSWRSWNAQRKVREAPLLYKCYTCGVGFWRFHQFRHHIRNTHKNINIMLETFHHESCLIAWQGWGKKPAPVPVSMERGSCPHCQEDMMTHVSQHRRNGYYVCEGCSEHFMVCSKMFFHKGRCSRYLQIMVRSGHVIQENQFTCPVCRCDCLTEERYKRHMIGAHSPRNDHIISIPLYKMCNLCGITYANYLVHACFSRHFIHQCVYCFRKFPTKILVQMHEQNSNYPVRCRTCDHFIPRKCMEIQHVIQHSRTYSFAFQCIELGCSTYSNLFPTEQSIYKHLSAAHSRATKEKRKGYIIMVVVPKTAEHLPEICVADIEPVDGDGSTQKATTSRDSYTYKETPLAEGDVEGYELTSTIKIEEHDLTEERGAANAAIKRETDNAVASLSGNNEPDNYLAAALNDETESALAALNDLDESENGLAVYRRVALAALIETETALAAVEAEAAEAALQDETESAIAAIQSIEDKEDDFYMTEDEINSILKPKRRKIACELQVTEIKTEPVEIPSTDDDDVILIDDDDDEPVQNDERFIKSGNSKARRDSIESLEEECGEIEGQILDILNKKDLQKQVQIVDEFDVEKVKTEKPDKECESIEDEIMGILNKNDIQAVEVHVNHEFEADSQDSENNEVELREDRIEETREEIIEELRENKIKEEITEEIRENSIERECREMQEQMYSLLLKQKKSWSTNSLQEFQSKLVKIAPTPRQCENTNKNKHDHIAESMLDISQPDIEMTQSNVKLFAANAIVPQIAESEKAMEIMISPNNKSYNNTKDSLEKVVSLATNAVPRENVKGEIVKIKDVIFKHQHDYVKSWRETNKVYTFTFMEDPKDQITAEKYQINDENDQINAENYHINAENDQITPSEVQITGKKKQKTAAKEHVVAKKVQITAEKDQMTAETDQTSSKEQITAAKDQIAAKKDQITVEKGQITAETDQLTCSKIQITAETDQLTFSKEQITVKKEQITAAKDQTTAEIDQSTSSKDRIFFSNDDSEYDEDDVMIINNDNHYFVDLTELDIEPSSDSTEDEYKKLVIDESKVDVKMEECTFEDNILTPNIYGRVQKIYKCKKCDYEGIHSEYKHHRKMCTALVEANRKAHDKLESKRYETRFRKDILHRDYESRTNDKSPKFKCSTCNVEFRTMKLYLLHFCYLSYNEDDAKHNLQYGQCPKCLTVLENDTKLCVHVVNHIKSNFIVERSISSLDSASVSGRKEPLYKCHRCKEVVTHLDFFPHWESHLVSNDFDTGSDDVPKESESNEVRVKEEKLSLRDKLKPENLKRLIDQLQISRETSANVPMTLLKVCVQCNRKFIRRNDCKRHCIEHLLRDALFYKLAYGVFKCQICGDLSKNPDDYKYHMRSHGGLPIYKCELCNKGFSDSSNFTKHKKVHNLDVLICDICKGKFQAKISLEKHMECHADQKTFYCDECDLPFNLESALRKHKRVRHTTQRRTFGCIYCKIRFSTVREKWDHLWEVHRERKQKADCPVCGSSFRKISDVKRHLKEVHSIDVSPAVLKKRCSRGHEEPRQLTSPPKPKPTSPQEPEPASPSKPKCTPPSKPKCTPPSKPKCTPPSKPKCTPPSKPKRTPPSKPKRTPPSKPKCTPPSKPKLTPPAKRKRATPSTPKDVPKKPTPRKPKKYGPYRPKARIITADEIIEQYRKSIMAAKEPNQPRTNIEKTIADYNNSQAGPSSSAFEIKIENIKSEKECIISEPYLTDNVVTKEYEPTPSTSKIIDEESEVKYSRSTSFQEEYLRNTLSGATRFTILKNPILAPGLRNILPKRFQGPLPEKPTKPKLVDGRRKKLFQGLMTDADQMIEVERARLKALHSEYRTTD